MTIEQEILANAAVLGPDARQKQNLHRLMHRLNDPELLIKMACSEGLACLLYKNLLASGALNILDSKGQNALQSCYYHTLSFNLKRINDLKQILYYLNLKKIPVVVLQGISLLGNVYKDLGLRPMVDIDLWVLKENYLPLADTLKKLGYRQDPVYPHTFIKDLTRLDLHTHILGADRIHARRLILAKRQHHIYHSTRLIDYQGQQALGLSRYDQVLYLSLHALKHNVNKLIWLVDVKNIVAQWDASDWKKMIDRAGEMAQLKAIFYVLFLLHQHFDFDLPQEIRPVFNSSKLHHLEKWILKQRKKQGVLPLWAALILFSPQKDFRQRLYFIAETFFPKPAILQQVFNQTPQLRNWQLYAKRFLQLSGKAFMFIKR